MGLAGVGTKLGGIIALSGVILLIFGISQMGNFEKDAVWKGTHGDAILEKGKYQVWYWGSDHSHVPAITIRDQNNIAVFGSNSGSRPSETMSIMSDEYAKAGTFEAVIAGNYSISQGSGDTKLYIMRDVMNPGVIYLAAGFAMMFLGIIVYSVFARIRQRSMPPAPANRYGGTPLPPQHGYEIGSGPDSAIRPAPKGQSRPSHGPEPGQMPEPRPLDDESQLARR